MSDLVPLATHDDRLRAIEAIPRTFEFAMEGNPFYGRILFETWTGLAAWALNPWAWNH